jgi:uncharacterized membrane protein YgdD (TMEM256/DUF423 family)
MHRSIQLRGIVFAAIAVILGAFGAHALKAVLPLDRIQVFETGVRYQIIHSIALIVLSLNLTKYEDATFASKWMHRAALFMTIGIVYPSFFLFAHCLKKLFREFGITYICLSWQIRSKQRKILNPIKRL